MQIVMYPALSSRVSGPKMSAKTKRPRPNKGFYKYLNSVFVDEHELHQPPVQKSKKETLLRLSGDSQEPELEKGVYLVERVISRRVKKVNQ